MNDFDEVVRRHAVLDHQLEQLGLTATDTLGDGIFFYRAISLVMYGTEDRHESLRKLVADHIESTGVMLGGIIDVSPDDNKCTSDHIKELRIIGTPVGEDAIIAMAEILHKAICVHIALTEPRVYRPTEWTDLLRIAFYEPGHYKAVFVHRLGTTGIHNNCSGSAAPPVSQYIA